MKKKLILLISCIIAILVYSQDIKKDTFIDYIKLESIGGKLDFKKILIEQGKDKKLLVYDGLVYHPDNFSILLWGKAVKKLGIQSKKEAIKLWETIYKRKLTSLEKKALRNGFNIKN